MFYTDNDFYADLRHAVLKCLRESNVSLLDINTKKLATYLCLSINRIKDNKLVSVSQMIEAEIIKSYEYQLASEIIALDIIKNTCIFPKEEIIVVALLLLCYRDIDLSLKSNLTTTLPAYLLHTTNLFLDTIKLLEPSFAKTFFNLQLIEAFQNDFISILYPIYIRSFFDTNKKKRLVTYYDLGDYKFSPLAVEITKTFFLKLMELINDEIDKSIITPFVGLVDFVLKKINYKYNPRRIAITSMGGYVVMRMTKEHIREKFDKYIKYIDTFEFYEMRRIDFNDYDVIISDMHILNNNYPLKLVIYNALALNDETINLFNECFIDGYDTTIINHMISLTTSIKQFVCDDYLTFFQLITYRYGLPEYYQEFHRSFFDKAKLLSNYNITSNISLIFCDYKYTHKEFIDIYFPTTKINFPNAGEVKAIVVVCLNPNYSIADIKLLNKIFQIIWYDNTSVYDLADNPDKTYKQLFQQVITNRFLRK